MVSSPDHPDLEASPEIASLDRDYKRYAVYWPAAPGLTPTSPTWTQEGVPRGWRAARFNPADGKLALGGPGYVYYVPAMHGPNPPTGDSVMQAHPARCPRCDADWSRRQIGSPIRTLRTGFQKIAQVLADALLRDIAPPGSSHARKLVVFSDSRQDAAKLSAGMRFSHYRDALRQAIADAIAVQGAGAQAFAAQLGGQALSAHQQALAASFVTTFPAEVATLSMAANALTALAPSPSHAGLSCQQAAQQILARAASGPFYIGQLSAEASSELLANGTNPGGFAQAVMWTDPPKMAGNWRDLFVWAAPGTPPQQKGAAQLSLPQREHLRRIQDQLMLETMDVVFASGRRSLESLRLAFATTDRIASPARSPLVQEAADGVIRLLGVRRRLSTHGAASQPNAPGYVVRYLDAIARAHGLATPVFAADVLNFLDGTGVLNQHVLMVQNLCLASPGVSYFECVQCRRIHLHASGGICTDCCTPLGPAQPLGMALGCQRLLQLPREASGAALPAELRRTYRTDEQE